MGLSQLICQTAPFVMYSLPLLTPPVLELWYSLQQAVEHL